LSAGACLGDCTVPDGASENQAVQWTTLRWGKMTRDLVLEDTKVLSDAIAAVPSRGT
jgi:hypothetical protein